MNTMEGSSLERLNPDDEAQRTADLFIGSALARQQLRAQRAPKHVAGVCSNCGAPCLPAAVYCDEACRADHEHREVLHARMRTSLG